jgi:hypothetical protein
MCYGEGPGEYDQCEPEQQAESSLPRQSLHGGKMDAASGSAKPGNEPH